MPLAVAVGLLLAQPQPPPPVDQLSPERPWTYLMGKALLAMGVLLLVAVVLGYLVKAREFRANVRRGGSK